MRSAPGSSETVPRSQGRLSRTPCFPRCALAARPRLLRLARAQALARGAGGTTTAAQLVDMVDLLEGVGQVDAARRIQNAVSKVLTERRALTYDLGGQATTAEVTAAIVAALK